MKVGTVHHTLAYVAAALAVVSVILAAISGFTGQTLVIARGTYLTLAVITILFAIYFLVEGAAYAAKKAK